MALKIFYFALCTLKCFNSPICVQKILPTLKILYYVILFYKICIFGVRNGYTLRSSYYIIYINILIFEQNTLWFVVNGKRFIHNNYWFFILLNHSLLIVHGLICHIVKLPFSMMLPFPVVNIWTVILYYR